MPAPAGRAPGGPARACGRAGSSWAASAGLRLRRRAAQAGRLASCAPAAHGGACWLDWVGYGSAALERVGMQQGGRCGCGRTATPAARWTKPRSTLDAAADTGPGAGGVQRLVGGVALPRNLGLQPWNRRGRGEEAGALLPFRGGRRRRRWRGWWCRQRRWRLGVGTGVRGGAARPQGGGRARGGAGRWQLSWAGQAGRGVRVSAWT